MSAPYSRSGEVPSNTFVNTMPQQSAEAVTNPVLDENSIEETGSVSSRDENDLAEFWMAAELANFDVLFPGAESSNTDNIDYGVPMSDEWWA